MPTLIYAANGAHASELAEEMRKEGGEFFPRQINAYCGEPEKCETLIMLDPSERVEAEHKGCEIVRKYDKPAKAVEPPASDEPKPAPKRRGRQSKTNAVSV